MGVEELMCMARTRVMLGSIYQMANGDMIGVDLSVWLYQLACFIRLADGDAAYHLKAATARREGTSSAGGEEVSGDPLWKGEEAPQPAGPAVIDADHQLAFMCWIRAIQGVITVDSDLLVLGAPVIYTGLKRDSTCQRLVLADMWRPLAAPPVGFTDSLAWLTEANRLGGESLAWHALRLYACIAKSDFNHIPQVGAIGATSVVCELLGSLREAMRGVPDAGTWAAFKEFVGGAAAVAAHAKHATRVREGPERLTLEAVKRGMLTAFTMFTRSLCVDLTRGVEGPLTGPPELDAAELALIGAPCLVSEEVVDHAMGRRRRGSQQHELTQLVLLYTWLPAAVLPLFELPEPFLHLDLSKPVPDWPRAITRVHLELFFKPPARAAPPLPAA
ncbi:hypothetical protein T492DRAFT_912764 [Pavlovales sp. CCMP2436]|nr:hypothetical protein T492DRAFT_912764 [Pavlovales sp. CCMP2436]